MIGINKEIQVESRVNIFVEVVVLVTEVAVHLNVLVYRIKVWRIRVDHISSFWKLSKIPHSLVGVLEISQSWCSTESAG
jgi:hypothetical protein